MATIIPPPQAASKATVPSPHAQLVSLVKLASAHLNEQIMPMVNRLVAVLLDVSDPSLDAHSVYHRVKAGNLLKQNGYAYFHIACTEIERSLRKEVGLLAPRKKAGAAAAEKLALVSMDDMDRSVAFGGISRPFEAACAELLATLNVRLGHLLARDSLRVGQNPFRPDLILMALQQAWTEFEPDAEAHGLLAPLLRPAVVFDFAPLYEALNASLTDSSGHAESLRIRKTDNAARAKAQRATGQAALAEQLRQFFGGDAAAGGEFDGAIPLIPDLPAMPAGSGGWRPSGAGAFRGAAGAQPFVAAAPPRGGPMVAGTYDGRAGHGAQYHGEPSNSAPMLAGTHDGRTAHFAPSQGAAAYPGFAEQGGQQHGGSHPGLLDMLAKLQLNLPEQIAGSRAGNPAAGAPHNAFYLPRLKESLPQGSLTRGDESTIDLLSRIFETVFVDENIPQETRELIQFLQVPVLKAALLDKNFFFQEAHPARRMIDLMSRMGWEQRRGADDPLFQAMQRGVDRIGRDAGAEVSVFAEAVADLEASIEAEETAATADISAPIAAALKQEKVSAATKSAKSAVALRIGSGELVAVVETFLEKKWTSVLTIAYSVESDKPGAVGSATRTMDDLIWSVKPKITQEQRKQLIGKLPGLLATLNKWLDIIKWQDAERLQFFAELAECHASIVRAPIELSPERQLEIALEVAQQDAMRRLEKEAALAAAEQAEAQQAEADPAVVTVDGLERGMWLEFTQADGSAQTVKLAWISPLRTLFIFSTGARKEAFSLTVEKLAEAYRQQSVRLVRQDGVVARALADAMAVNDPICAAA